MAPHPATATEHRPAGTTRWWWIRHAPVTANNGRLYGQDDWPADTDDSGVFAGLARTLPAAPVLVISALKRTHQTAAAIAAAGLALPDPIVEPALNEQHFGSWQGRPFDEVRRELGSGHLPWLAPADLRAPGGESFADLAARVAATIGRLTAAHGGRDIVAVAHGGTIRAAIGLALGVDHDTALGFTLANCSLTRLDFRPSGDDRPHGSWSVVHVNHLVAA